MRKALISLAILIVFAPLAAVGPFLVISLSNPNLNPEAARVLAQAKRGHLVPGNAYYALIGFRLEGPARAEAKVFASIAWQNPVNYVRNLRETQVLRKTVYRKLSQ